MSESAPSTDLSVDEDIFNKVLMELHKQIIEETKRNHKKKLFYTRGRISDTLERLTAQIKALANITAKYMQLDPRVQNARQCADVFVEKVYYGSHHGCIGKVLAVMAAVHSVKAFSPTNRHWQRFFAKCISFDKIAALDDSRLPFKQEEIEDLLEEDYGKLFHQMQAQYSAPVLRRGHDEPQNLDIDAPLPYLEETLLTSGKHGDIYVTRIEKSHVILVDDGKEFTSTNDQVYARKDILRSDRKQDVREWSIFQLIKANRDNYDQYVMKIHACCVFEDKVSLFMERADCDLATFMACTIRPQPLQAKQYLEMINNIASALEYLHDNIKDKAGKASTLLHSDVKPENILVISPSQDTQTKGSLKQPPPKFLLADFGVSKVKRASKDKVYIHGLTGSKTNPPADDRDIMVVEPGSHATESKMGRIAPCVSPEGLSGFGLVDEKADVWGFSCVLLIYLSWLCIGKYGPADFEKERAREAHDLPRFVRQEEHDKWSINPAVTGWLAQKIKEAVVKPGNSNKSELLRAQIIFDYLLGEVMYIAPSRRPRMCEVRQRLTDIADMTREGFWEWQAAHPSFFPPSDSEPGSHESSQHVQSSLDPTAFSQDVIHEEGTQAVGAQSQDRHVLIAAIGMIEPDAIYYSCVRHDARKSVMLSSSTSPVAFTKSTKQPEALSFLSWIPAGMQEASAITWWPGGGPVACLHGTNTTVFSVTSKLELSTCVAVSCLDYEHIQTLTMSERYLCLVKKSLTFELIFHRIDRLFTRTHIDLTVSAPYQAASPFMAYVVASSQVQPECVASTSAGTCSHSCVETIAYTSADDGHGSRQLTILDLDLEALASTKIAGEELARSTITLSFQSPVHHEEATQFGNKLTFSADGKRLFWTAEHRERAGIDVTTHVRMWQLSAAHEWQGPFYLKIKDMTPSNARPKTSYIKSLVAPRHPVVLAVYQSHLQFHNFSTEFPRIQRLEGAQLPIVNAATEDFKTFYLVTEHGPGHYVVLGVRQGTEVATLGSLHVFSSTEVHVPGAQSQPDDHISEALTLRIQGRLCLLLIWRSKHSMLIDVDPKETKASESEAEKSVLFIGRRLSA